MPRTGVLPGDNGWKEMEVKELKGMQVEKIVVTESKPEGREVRACDMSGTIFLCM